MNDLCSLPPGCCLRAVLRPDPSTLRLLVSAARQATCRWGTARRFAKAQSFPGRAVRAPEPSLLDPHVGWLQAQLALGRDNASALWRELRARGYPGGLRPGAALGAPAPTGAGQKRAAPLAGGYPDGC